MSTSQRDQELLCEFVRKSSTCAACQNRILSPPLHPSGSQAHCSSCPATPAPPAVWLLSASALAKPPRLVPSRCLDCLALATKASATGAEARAGAGAEATEAASLMMS
ncbi:uncharacterized protein Dmoj_GI26624 [Drosophila mojavensis]|uniref:Uncharacterized protein n=1 Tax=Drosophila mojavensis TaxID=7230 RepID=A0A0Q9XGQ3_DROMO|nr:uncharacterized protein Dmoj_GI26624 [Drosophila mojavensis]